MKSSISEEQACLQLGVKKQEQVRTWGQTALLLEAVETYGIWRKEADSFSEWIRFFAKQLGKKEGSLWRYLTSGRYYKKLIAKLSEHAIDCPPITSLPEKVSAESLEILAKIERVVPLDLFIKLSTGLLSGEVSRYELRRTWETFRPAFLQGKLQDKTTKGSISLSVDRRDNSQLKAWVTALSIQFLKNSHAIWLPKKLSDSYRILIDVSVCPRKQKTYEYVFDAVIALHLNRYEGDAELMLHGVKVSDIDLTKSIDAVKHLTTYCDVMWFSVCHGHFDDLIPRLNEIPSNVGILLIGDKGVTHVHRVATQGLDIGVNFGTLARIMMLKFLH